VFAVMSGQSVVQAQYPLPAGGLAIYTGAALTYAHGDWLSSGRLVSSSTQTMVSDSAYAPFGEQYAATGSSFYRRMFRFRVDATMPTSTPTIRPIFPTSSAGTFRIARRSSRNRMQRRRSSLWPRSRQPKRRHPIRPTASAKRSPCERPYLRIGFTYSRIIFQSPVRMSPKSAPVMNISQAKRREK
jgi:hypothetical protein